VIFLERYSRSLLHALPGFRMEFLTGRPADWTPKRLYCKPNGTGLQITGLKFRRVCPVYHRCFGSDEPVLPHK
jgi:hypothetical protein